MIELCFAATMHFGLGEGWQDKHPCVRYEMDGVTVGAYLNSENDLSVYASHTWNSGQWFAELGAVTGYEGAAVAPMLRGGYNLSDNAAVFISPAMTTRGQVGVVAGIEISMGVLQ